MGDERVEDPMTGRKILSPSFNNSNNSISNKEENETKIEELGDECMLLRSKLEALRKKRQHVAKIREKQTILIESMQERMNDCTKKRQQAVLDRRSSVLLCQQASSALALSEKWNVTNDCFHIWHQGSFGLINGLRLGSESQRSSSFAAINSSTIGGSSDSNNTYDSNNNNNNRARTESSGGSSSDHLFRYMGFLSPTSSSSDNKTPPPSSLSSPTSSLPQTTTTTTPKVPWSEINSALGQVALLLFTIERKNHCGIKFRHKILPMGSTSKIGLRSGSRGGAETVTYYNLYSDDSFQFFGKRNFNTALQALVQCVADASEAIQKRDRTISFPHPIEMISASSRETTIGGIPISYNAAEGVAWTKAMKYLLTDIKWCVAYTAKHVDR